jgi:hypothetical protein
MFSLAVANGTVRLANGASCFLVLETLRVYAAMAIDIDHEQ